jgi:hypothetical protein
MNDALAVARCHVVSCAPVMFRRRLNNDPETVALFHAEMVIAIHTCCFA